MKPAGQHVPLADLPLNIIPLADNRHALAATAGYNAHELSLDRPRRTEKSSIARRSGRAGSAWRRAAEADRIWWSGGGGNRAARVSARRIADLTRTERPEPAATKAATNGEPRHFRAGIALDPRERCSIHSTSMPGRSRPSISPI